MTQILLQIEDESIFPALEEALMRLKGIKVKTITDVPSTQTSKAIKDAIEGKVTPCKNSDDMFAKLK